MEYYGYVAAGAVEHVSALIAASGRDYRCWETHVLLETAFLRRALPEPSPKRVQAIELYLSHERARRAGGVNPYAYYFNHGSRRELQGDPATTWHPPARLLRYERPSVFVADCWCWLDQIGNRYAVSLREHQQLAIAAIWRGTQNV